MLTVEIYPGVKSLSMHWYCYFRIAWALNRSSFVVIYFIDLFRGDFYYHGSYSEVKRVQRLWMSHAEAFPVTDQCSVLMLLRGRFDVLIICVLCSLKSQTVNALRPCTEVDVRDEYTEDDITLDPLIVLRCDSRVFRFVTSNCYNH